MSSTRLGFIGFAVLGIVGVASACGTTGGRTTFEDPDATADASTLPGNGEGGPILIDPDSGTAPCPEGKETTITGKVFDPAGKNPLYNIQVFIPNGDLPVLKVGLPDSDPATGKCFGQTCDTEVLNPLAASLTNTKGEFVLKGPRLFPGKDVPLVMQIGKWRRKIVIPEVKACQENKLPNSDTRLPKNGREGDMPQIMMSLGSYDALECLLYGIGVDNDEFEAGYTTPSKHIHVYRGIGGGSKVNGQNVPDSQTVWNSAANMQKFDITMLACEGTPDTSNKPDLNVMRSYTTGFGGRVFATHYHSQWAFKSAWGETVVKSTGGTSTSNDVYPINTTFPKGQALSDWLVEVRATNTPGQITLSSPSTYQGGLASATVGQEWIGKGNAAKYVSFNTPVDEPAAKQCGRFVISDVHAAGDASGGKDLPSSACSGLNAQLSAIEFMFFDLSSCVQDETKVPEIPK